MKLSAIEVEEFRAVVWQHYRVQARSMPWRETITPYHILVSEMMLQQTQVSRVLPKFNEFLKQFPTLQCLAQASLKEVLEAWSGLGYNRRARYLYEAARRIILDFDGEFPQTIEMLTMLPGIGKNTAGAIMAYAFDRPVVFIETNIRTALFYHFFSEDEKVEDKVLYECMEQLLDRDHPREWYWAMMDYGSYLKKTVRNNRISRHYKKQGAFKGSQRELRGRIMRSLIRGSREISILVDELQDERLGTVLELLQAEGLIQIIGDQVQITDYSWKDASSTIEM